MTLSLITAAQNAASTLPDCLSSVAEQVLPARVTVEHLVMDGLSTDTTPCLLKTWQGEEPTKRRFWSEADDGFYDALNRGVERAKGVVIGFLNADDFYPSNETLAWVARQMSDPSVAGVYGDLIYVTPESGRQHWKVTRRWKSGPYGRRSFWWGWMPPHPTIFVRREVWEAVGGFRTDLGSAADYEWMLRTMVKEAIPLSYLPKRLVAMRQGGMSNRSFKARLKANRHDRRAWTVNGLRPYPWTMLCKPLRKIGQFLPCR